MRLAAVVLSALVSLCIVSNARAGLVHEWSHVYGDTLSQYVGNVVADPFGNVVIGGSFRSSITFDVTYASVGSRDIVVAKLDAGGTPLWSHTIGNPFADTSWDITTDLVGNVVLSGSTAPNPDDRPGIVVKYSPTGVVQWTRDFVSSGDYAYAELVTTDANKHVIVAGSFDGTVDFAGGEMTATTGADVYLVKLNASGNFLWGRHFHAADGISVQGLEVDALGQVVLTGEFGGSTNFGDGALTDAGFGDIYVAKFTANGDLMWSRRYGGTDTDGVAGLAVTAAGDIMLAGQFSSSTSFGGDPLNSFDYADVFLARLSPSGAHVWSKSFPGLDYQDATDLDLTSNGDLLLTCYGFGDIDFGAGSLTAQGVYDMFVARFYDSGSLRWHASFTSPGGILGMVDEYDGDIILGGASDGTVDFGGGDHVPHGDQDIFVARFEDALPVAVGAPRTALVLGQNNPNPFNPATSIPYALDAPARVVIGIYDLAGARVARLDQGARGAGTHEAAWNGRDDSGRAVASGVYFYRVEGLPQVSPRKMVLLK